MTSEESQKPSLPLSRKDYAKNTVQSILLGIPYIGPSLERFISGPLVEKRWQRLEQTLTEVALKLKQVCQTQRVLTEEFIVLLEEIAPPLCRVTTNTKREWFKELLFHAALTPPGDCKWEEARLAANLIEKIELPGLEVLGALHSLGYIERNTVVVFDNQPKVALWHKDLDTPTRVYPLNFKSAVVEEWTRRLSDLRVIRYVHPIHRPQANSKNQTINGGDQVALTQLGQLIVRWGMETDP